MTTPDAAFVFGVDLDGVCADFYAGIRPIAAEWLAKRPDELQEQISYGMPEWGIDKEPGGYDELHRFAVNQRDLFKRLDPMPGAARVLRRLSSDLKIRIRIVTHRLYVAYSHKLAVTQTVEWLDHHGFPYWDLCFMRDKAAVGADLYVEDSPRNIQDLIADGHRTICFSNSTNRQVQCELRAQSWDEVERIVTAEEAAWRRRQGQSKRLPGE